MAEALSENISNDIENEEQDSENPKNVNKDSENDSEILGNKPENGSKNGGEQSGKQRQNTGSGLVPFVTQGYYRVTTGTRSGIVRFAYVATQKSTGTTEPKTADVIPPRTTRVESHFAFDRGKTDVPPMESGESHDSHLHISDVDLDIKTRSRVESDGSAKDKSEESFSQTHDSKLCINDSGSVMSYHRDK